MMHGPVHRLLKALGFGSGAGNNKSVLILHGAYLFFNLRVLIVAMACNLASLLLCLNIAYAVSSKDILSVYKTGENRGDYTLREDISDGHMVWGSFEDDISSNG